MPLSSRCSWAALLAVLVVPSSATAAAMAPAPMPVPLPSVVVDGTARVDARRVQVRCREVAPDAYGCDVELHFRLTAEERITLRREGDATWTVQGEGIEDAGYATVWLVPEDVFDPETGEPLASPERVVEVTLRFSRTLSIGSVDHEDFWVLAPLRGRHLLLGDGGDVRREGGHAYGDLIEGAGIRLEGELVADVEAPDAIAVNVAGHPVHDGVASVSAVHSGLLLAAIPEPEAEPFPIQHGGPVLAAGAVFDLRGEGAGRFLLRGAYELAVEGHFIGSISLETDFESIYESLVIEAASPEILVLLPSVAAGVGIVARQLGNRDADAALRLRLGVNFIAIGATYDFDYWPATGEWTSTIVGRISI